MNGEAKYILAVISTFSILIPIFYCGWAIIIRAKANLWLFLIFLLFGFVVDFLSWYSYVKSPGDNFRKVISWLYEVYPVVEAIFFFWIIKHYDSLRRIKKLSFISILMVLPLWLMFNYLFDFIDFFDVKSFGLFHMLYRVVAAFLACYSLLSLLETNINVHNRQDFWFLTGIFIYNFATFCILLIRGTEIASQLWYLHNVMNIITYLFYTIGFYYSALHSSNSQKV